MPYNNNSSKSPLVRNNRFDALKTTTSYKKDSEPKENEWQTQSRRSRKPSVNRTSDSKLFSLNQTSLGDFMKDKCSKNEKYVSPAMRNNRSSLCSTFQVHEDRKKKKKNTLDLSGNMFPAMEGSSSSNSSSTSHNQSTKYLEAVEIKQEEYHEQQRAIQKQKNTHVYSENDRLDKQQHNDVNQNEAEHEEEKNNEKELVCPYAAAKAAMGMLRFHQRNRDEQNDVFGAQSEYWGTKSLLDFTFDLDDDSNYASSSQEEEEEEEDEDDYYYDNM